MRSAPFAELAKQRRATGIAVGPYSAAWGELPAVLDIERGQVKSRRSR
jgi:hypothetical protein